MTRKKREKDGSLGLGFKVLLMTLAMLLLLLILQGPVWGEFVVDEEKGIVTDTTTGLMWEQSPKHNGKGMTWEEAVSYCDSLQLAGFDDWRLPNSTELQSIIDHQMYSSPSSPRVFPGTEASGYWSSTVYRANDEYAWRINFYYVGYMNISKKSNLYFVRAVRNAP